MILGLDLSSKKTGICVFDNNKLVDYNCISSSKNDSIERIKIMIKGIQEFCNKYPIDTIVIEEVRPEKTVLTTYKILMYLQAAVVFFFHDYLPNSKFFYLQASEWRAACGIKTGRGIKREALKAADIAFVKKTFNIDVNDDIADAICIVYGYLNKIKTNNQEWV